MPFKATPIEQRLRAKIMFTITPTAWDGRPLSTPCWQWIGGINKTGYGIINVNKIPRLAHRVSYETFKEEIPQGLSLDHLCRNRKCINPEHLEPVTRAENIKRGLSLKTQSINCKNGHPRSENKIIKSGRIRCKECERIKNHNYYERAKARGLR